MSYIYRAKRDTENPCAICGWAQHMAVHLPVKGGDGRPYGHSYHPRTLLDAEAVERLRAALGAPQREE